MESVVDLVGELRGLVDRLLAADVAGVGSFELDRLMVTVQTERERLAVAAGDVVHRWQRADGWRADGSLTALLALGRDTHTCETSARRELRRGRALQQMPLVRAAVIAGRLSMDHLDLLARYATPPRWELFVRDERLLVDQCAAARLFEDASKLVRYWADKVDEELGRHPRPLDPSRLYASRDGATGEVHLDGVFNPIDGEIVTRELDRLTREITLEDKANGVTRTRAQRRAAALVRMASRSINATGVTARPLFQVIIGDHTAARLCELATGTVIHPNDLEPHLDAAVVESFLFDGPTTIIATSRRRTFTGALRRAIQVRDRRCQHRSGCPTPAVDCDIDHHRPHAAGGATSQFNGRAECIPHNRLPHLHDPPDPADPPDGEQPPRSQRNPDILDELRCRIRWRQRILDPERFTDTDEPDDDD